MDCILCKSAAGHFVHVHQNDYFQCRQCGLIFLDPSQRVDAVLEKKKYDQHQNNPHDPGYRDFLRPAVDAITSNVKSGASGLDFGAGPGPTVSVMLSEKNIKCANYDPFYNPDQALLEKTYDFVVCTEAIEHFFQPMVECKRIKSMLKPKAVFVCMTLFFDDPEDFKDSYYHRDPTHVGFYSQKTCKWVAEVLSMDIVFPSPNIALFSNL